MRYLVMLCLLMTGCASSSLTGFCGRVSTQESTVPYVGGKGNLDGYLCNVHCIGKCDDASYKTLSDTMGKYQDAKTTNGTLSTTGPGVITFIPGK